MPQDEVDWEKLFTGHCTEDKRYGIGCGLSHIMLWVAMGSHRSQMLAFRTADLGAQQQSLDAYTSAPAHNLKSVTASASSFLDYDTSRSPSPAQQTDSTVERTALLSRLQAELDGYLSERRMDRFKTIDQATVYCDPLRYWAVCIFTSSGDCFSAICAGCWKEVPIPLSTCNGHPSSTGIFSILWTALFLKQGDMHPSPKPHQPTTHGSTPDHQVFLPLWHPSLQVCGWSNWSRQSPLGFNKYPFQCLTSCTILWW